MPYPFSRRHFLKASTAFGIGLPFLGGTAACLPLEAAPAIQTIIDRIKAACGAPIDPTVDTVKSADPAVACTGIVCTFLATTEVIHQAIAQGANLIITHEPTYYNHLDETEWLEEDPVYLYKRSLLEDHGIVVWRFHDYWHQHTPDGILEGFLRTVEWASYLDPSAHVTCALPEMNLLTAARHLQDRLKLQRTFYVGDPEMSVRRIGLLPGAWGRQAQIEALRREDLDAIAVGEVAEWETCEWVRDANRAGLKKGLIILGHADSEEPGMRYLVEWLQPQVPEIRVAHVPATDPFVPV